MSEALRHKTAAIIGTVTPVPGYPKKLKVYLNNASPFWQAVSHANPFFYMIDGFRFGFFGQSDVPPLISFGIVAVFFALLAGIAVKLLQSGYKLRY